MQDDGRRHTRSAVRDQLPGGHNRQITATLASDAGNYRVVISNGVTSFISANASLTVLILPRIISAVNVLG